jgi:hypothetical protein
MNTDNDTRLVALALAWEQLARDFEAFYQEKMPYTWECSVKGHALRERGRALSTETATLTTEEAQSEPTC